MKQKGFSLNLESESRLSGKDLSFVTPLADEGSKAKRFVGLSAAAHVLLAVGIATMSAPIFEAVKTETVIFEIEEPAGSAPVVATPVAAEPAPVAAAAPVVAPKTTAPAQAAVPAQQVAPVATPKGAAAPQAVAAVSDVAVPASIDELHETEALDESQFEAKLVAAKLDDGDLDKDFAKIDTETTQKVGAAGAALAKDAETMAQDDLSALDEIDRANQDQAALMAAQAAALKNKNAQALAAVQAQEAADAARAAAAAKAGAGHGGGQGPGQGKVRSLEQLRQQPGNPRPAYADSERMAQQQGQVVFLAYVGRDGTPTEFRQVRSSGHANLDQKTLAALKRWKFYPGQEGWVEIPFSWDLRGGPQETSALSRRKVSQKAD